jgi:protocatechuate 3,4-dioxygenase, beta subunit
MNRKRRSVMLGLCGASVLSSSAIARALVLTPRQTAGPFYPVELPLDDDNDLTHVKGRNGRALGQISEVSGRVVDINGRPLSGMRIEIWQCDFNGRYRHPRENGSRSVDPYFQGHGQTLTNHLGQYRFRTIRPVHYPGRTPHIHVAVFPDQEDPFVTQLYVAGDARNETDVLYNSIPREKRDLVTAEFVASNIEGAELQANFDLILNRRDGTPLQS